MHPERRAPASPRLLLQLDSAMARFWSGLTGKRITVARDYVRYEKWQLQMGPRCRLALTLE